MEQQLHRIVSAVIQEADASAGRLEWTPQAKLQMTKLILTQAQTLGADLEAFAKYARIMDSFLACRHAKRATVQPDDLRLALRRNPYLMEKFHEFMQALAQSKPSKKPKTEDKPTPPPPPPAVAP